MSRTLFATVAVAVASSATLPVAVAGETNRPLVLASAARPCPGCRPIETTVMVPQVVYETRKVRTVRYRPEVRQQKVVVCRMVPETRELTSTCTVMVPEVRTRTITTMTARPVTRMVTRSCVMSIPHAGAHGCVACKPEVRTYTYPVCDVQFVPVSRQVTYTAQVPKIVTRARQVSFMKPTYVEQTQSCTVMVPYTVEEEVRVPVCKLVPKKIVCYAPGCAG